MLTALREQLRRRVETVDRLTVSRRDTLIMLGYQLAGTLLEMLGLLIMLPVVQYLQVEGDMEALIAQNPAWKEIVGAYALIGLEVNLATLMFTSFCCLMARQSFLYVRARQAAKVKFALIARLRRTVFGCYLWTSADYHDRHPVGELIEDIASQVDQCAANIMSGVTVIGFSIMILCYIGGLFAISAPTTLTAIAALCLGLVAMRHQLKLTRIAGRQLLAATRATGNFVVERLQSVRLIRLSGTEIAEQRRIDDLTEQQREADTRLMILSARIELLLEPIVIGSAFGFIYVALTVYRVPFAEIGLFGVFLLRLLPIIKQLFHVYQARLGNRPALIAIDELITNMRAAKGPQGGDRVLACLREGIGIEDVRFRYASRPEISALNGLSLHIPAASTVAIVGPSGAGKSTLIDMLPRLREPESGCIRLDGIPIETFSLDSLRRYIAYVPQTAQLFNGSVADHIRYGKADATEAEIRAAARLANCLAFIEALPEGFNTSVGQRGADLSGGQRQRLDLARALVRRVPLLVLDEPTSNLDAEAESDFIHALRRIRAETSMTILLVTHRLSTAQVADRVVVLDAGRAVAAGTPQEVMDRSEWYRNALRTQMMGAVTGRGADSLEPVPSLAGG